MNVPDTFFSPNERENTLHPLQTSIWTHQTQASGKQPGEAGQLTAVALVRGIYSLQGSVVSMGTALLAFAGFPELVRCTKRSIRRKRGAERDFEDFEGIWGTFHWMWAIWLQHARRLFGSNTT